MRTNLLIIGLSVLFLSLFACKKTENSSSPSSTTFDNEFTWGVVDFYGSYYERQGIENNVFSIDLYSSGLHQDSLGRIAGTGTNIYFSDVFLSSLDSFLCVGSYTNDTTGMIFTYLPGKEYEGSFTGAYLLKVEENSYSVELIKSGSFLLAQRGDTTCLKFELIKNSDGKVYSGSYKGILPQTNKIHKLGKERSIFVQRVRL